jgi:Uma2 family endonuclease
MAMPLAHRRFTVDEYHRMAEAGILGADDRVELLDGEIVQVSPIGARHAATVTRLEHLFHRLARDRAIIRGQNPVRLDNYSEPEPDIALVTPRDDFYAAAHPAPHDVLLIVEVADTSLRYDRHRKLPGYARAGIPEVWLVDLTGDRVESHREPRGDAYASQQILGRDATLTPLRLPGITVPVGDLLA